MVLSAWFSFQFSFFSALVLIHNFEVANLILHRPQISVVKFLVAYFGLF